MDPNRQSWRHKFLTPKKPRSKKSWMNETPAVPKESSNVSVLVLDGTGNSHPHPLSYSILRNISLSLEFLENHNRNLCEILPPRSTIVQSDVLKSFVELILKGGEMTNFDLLKTFDFNIFSRGLRTCIALCEPVVPPYLEQELTMISDCNVGEEEKVIHKYISNEKWNEINVLLFTSILEHSGKLQLLVDKQGFNRLASTIGNILCPGDQPSPFFPLLSSIPFSKERRRRRAIKKILRYLESSNQIETKVIVAPSAANTRNSPAQDIDIDIDNDPVGIERASVRKVLFAEHCDHEQTRHEAIKDQEKVKSGDAASILNDMKDYGHFVETDSDEGWNADRTNTLLIRTRSRIYAAEATLQEYEEMRNNFTSGSCNKTIRRPLAF